MINFNHLIRLASNLSTGALLAAVLWNSPAQAQVNVSPMIVEAQANRGQAQGVIKITNVSNEPYRARIYTEPFTYDRDQGFQTLKSSPNDLSPYLQFSPRELTLKPGQSRRVRLISRLAPNLPDGEYRAVVFTEELKQTLPDTTANRVVVKTRIGVTVYVRKGNVSPKIAVDNVSLNPKESKLQLLVRNTGKASIHPKATWTLKQGATKIKTNTEDLSVVLAGSERNLILNYPEKNQSALAPGKYLLTGELSWEEEEKTTKVPFNVSFTIPAVNASR